MDHWSILCRRTGRGGASLIMLLKLLVLQVGGAEHRGWISDINTY